MKYLAAKQLQEGGANDEINKINEINEINEINNKFGNLLSDITKLKQDNNSQNFEKLINDYDFQQNIFRMIALYKDDKATELLIKIIKIINISNPQIQEQIKNNLCTTNLDKGLNIATGLIDRFSKSEIGNVLSNTVSKGAIDALNLADQAARNNVTKQLAKPRR